jgi:signal transduction histidine kinase
LVNLVMADAIERVRATADQRGIEIVLQEPSPPVAVLGDRRQLVSAMHALLENAITYSYDNSKVVVTGNVHRSNPNLEHPAARRHEAPVEAADGGEGAGSDDTPASGQTPVVKADGAAPAAEEGPIEPVFTPEILEAYKPPDEDAGVAPPATGSTLSTLPPVEAEKVEPAGTAQMETTSAGSPSWRVEERDSVRLSVQDHGVGIPARDLDRIFERFYRVDHGRSRDTGGTGLGLSIVRHVANNHQGWVDVESREGEGSTFTLVLPIQTMSA